MTILFFSEIFFVVQLMLNQPCPLNIRSDGKVLSLTASASYNQGLGRSIVAQGMAQQADLTEESC